VSVARGVAVKVAVDVAVGSCVGVKVASGAEVAVGETVGVAVGAIVDVMVGEVQATSRANTFTTINRIFFIACALLLRMETECRLTPQ